MTPTAPSSSASIVVLSCLLLLSSTTTAFNISRILSQYPDYSVFNSILNQTHLVPEVNRRQTITVLVVKDSEMSAITSKPIETQKMIISTHIVLDYYDQQKLTHLKSGSSLLTTLFQTTGVASWNNGFLNVTNKKADGIVFGSGTKGSPLNSHLKKYVFAQPYNISVIEVSSVIIAPGLDGAPIGPAMPPTPAAANAPAPGPSKKKAAAAPAPEEAEVPVAEVPVAEEPVADAPVAEEPVADTPASAPGPVEADKPADDDKPTPPTKSSAAKAFASSLVLMVSFIANL